MSILSSTYRAILTPRISIAGLVLAMLLASGATWYGGALGRDNRASALLGAAPIGTEVFTDVASLSVEKVREDAIGVMPFTPREGYAFVIPTIVVTNLSDVERDLIPTLTLYIKDSQGNVYNMAMAPVLGEQFGGPIMPHDKVRQELAFEVKKGAKGLVLYFETGGKVLAVSLGAN